MGTFLVNVHVRTDDHDALARELRGMPVGGCWVIPAQHGWSTVYEERASTQDDQWIQELTAGVSRQLQAPAIAFLVHDSDIFCYWLFDRGEPLDEYNSCPDYFGTDDSGNDDRERVQGRPDVLLRFCVPGTLVHDVERALEQRPMFAESQLGELAPMLGIDVERVMVDYRDLGSEISSDEIGAVFVGTNPPPATPRARAPGFLRLVRDDDGEGDDDDGDGTAAAGAAGRSSRLPPGTGMDPNAAHWLGLAPGVEPPDPLVSDLVQAAADGNLAEIDRLVAAGANLEGTAPLKKAPQGPKSLTSQMLGGGPLSIPISPLHAAIAAKQTSAAKRLIELGVDVHVNHPLFGTPVHAAVSAGAPEILQALLEAGAGPNDLSSQRQTPLAMLRALRQMMAQFEQLRSLGTAMPGNLLSQFDVLMPTEGWDECERILLEHDGA